LRALLGTGKIAGVQKARSTAHPKPPSRWLWAVVGFVAAIAIGGVVAIVVAKYLQTGQWQMPSPGEVVEVIAPKAKQPARFIYLERNAVELKPGIDDAPAGVSSVLANGKNAVIKTTAFKGPDKTWKALLACTQTMFAPFAVTVTDQRPTDDDFVLVAIGGKATDVGNIIANPVVFVFAAALNNNVRAMCETIGMEVAHAYGLDHGYHCPDVMTYLSGCGAKKFVDKAVRCGEHKARACHNGQVTQNSYQHLLRVLGPAVPPLPTPERPVR
jgi:hypothetical protein